MRIIFSLEFELEPANQSGPNEFLVIPLDRDGQSDSAHAEPPKRRVVDLCAGDYLIYRWQRRRVLGVRAYSETQWNEQDVIADGYIIVASDIAPRSMSSRPDEPTGALRGT